MTQKRSLEMKMVEAVFCILYLIFVFATTLIFFCRGWFLRAMLSGVLAIGDSFLLFHASRSISKAKARMTPSACSLDTSSPL